MQLILHCGFPKTGTTALQSWCASHEEDLLARGIFYPPSGRDYEGIGHHLLGADPQITSSHCAERIVKACANAQQACAFISTESLSNRLNTEDESGAAFFLTLVEELRRKSIDAHLIITVRSLPEYLRSITVQNIVYDGENRRPISFASFVLHGISRAYRNLFTILETHKQISILPHSHSVNREILQIVFGLSNSSLPTMAQVERSAPSPSTTRILPFMWMNHLRLVPSPDFISYLQHESSVEDIVGTYIRTSKMADKLARGAQNWKPDANLVHSVIEYLKESWRRNFDPRLPAARSKSEMVLRERMAMDCADLVPDDLISLDLLYSQIEAPENEGGMAKLFEQLLSDGSCLFGQDFTSQLRHSGRAVPLH